MAGPKRIPELRTEIVFLFDLVRQVVDGKLKIPRFQRVFVWRADQMLDLLDSINLQYPIGSLLVWDTDTEIFSLKSVGPVTLDEGEGTSATYLLDGHQRISTIAGALVSPEDRVPREDDEAAWKWNIYFNAREQVFVHLHLGQAPGSHEFPMSKILDTFAFIVECQRVLTDDPVNGRLYVQRIQDVARTFQNYKIPVIQIRQTGLTEAVEIFARLNSKGQVMTADQMVSALLYREGTPNPFDLGSEISTIMSGLEARGFGDIDRTLILRALLAAIGEDVYRTDWTRVALSRREDLLGKMREAIPGVQKSIGDAADFLAEEGVRTERLIPYGMQLIVISSFFYAQPKPSVAQIALLKRWFWVTSFSTWFGGANPSRVNGLVRDVMDNMALELDEPQIVSLDMNTPATALPRSFDMRSARTRTLLIVLFDLNPLDRHGNEIRDPDFLVQIGGPAALGYVASTSGDAELGRSPANRMIRDSPKDRRQASSWLDIEDGGVRRRVWASHAIPDTAITALRARDMPAFLQQRLEEIRRIELEFMKDRGVALPNGTTSDAFEELDNADWVEVDDL